MSLFSFIKASDQWMEGDGPMHHSIVSSRARYARNLPRLPFVPRAKGEQLGIVLEKVDEAVDRCPYFRDFRRLSISDIHSLYRVYLKESHLLSSELEQGGEHRVIYISPDYRISIMVNEEDHVRIQCLENGFQIRRSLALCQEVEAQLENALHFARSDRFGVLTACPTNVGTGLRLSVMFHLPGLVIVGKVQDIIQSINQYGLTVRGIYGENSQNLGDYYQMSNEITMGKEEADLCATLERVSEQIVERELAARDALFEQKPLVVRDLIQRSLAILKNAQILDSAEAMAHLSKIRLGIDRGYFRPLGHADLSRLMMEIQPAHMQCKEGGQIPAEQRDGLRADYLQKRLKDISYN
ncbi:ATP--guanido phosphotransferase, partial [bacterium]|nr:ATP--guanido phosphotransferase [bacterium]